MYVINSKAIHKVYNLNVKNNDNKKSRINKLNKMKKAVLAFAIVLFVSGVGVLIYSFNIPKPDGSIGTFTNEEMKHYEWSKNDTKQVPYNDSASSELSKGMQDILNNGEMVRT